jgi:(E)-4-hydroxy-3-methylbut-2-enyl-diphosphate synthase
MGDKEQIARVVTAAKEREVPIRIGVNAGSLPANFQPRAPLARRMVRMALEQIRLMESLDFDLIKVSLKAFDVPTTIEAYQMIADRMPYPLHLGVTEAGLFRTGAIRSAIGIGILLYQGIGDTIRVSLTAHPCEEVFVAYEILKSLGLRQRGPTLVSCPSCGRAEVDIIALAEAVSKGLGKLSNPIKVAIMGCVVNGPGEARDADVGIACGKGKGAIFRKGKVVGTVSERNLLEALMSEVSSLVRED